MSEATNVTPIEPRKAITVTVAERYGMEADAFEVALRNTVFLEGSKAEYAAFLVVSNEYRLNPLTKEIYAVKNKRTGKIVPVVSIDGWVTLCNSNPAFDGLTFEDLHDDKNKLYAITCSIYRKDRSRPTVVTEYLAECIRDTEPWKMQHRMLRHKSLIQCARYAFGFSGIYDEDEAERFEATLLPEVPPAMTSGFPEGAKPARRPRKAAEPAPSNDAGAAGDGPPAPQVSVDGADEAHDAVFEDIAEEEPASEAGDGEGDAEEEEEPASEEPPAAPKRAPADVYYTLTGDAPNAEGRVPTYFNGKPHSTVKPDAKACPDAYDDHPLVVEPQEEEPQAAADNSDAIAVATAIASARGLLAARQMQKTFLASDAGAEATTEVKAGLRLALWKRYGELFEQKVETIAPYEDFDLMRSFLEFGAKTPEDCDAMWTRHYHHAAYKNASESNQRALTDLLVRRKADLKPGE